MTAALHEYWPLIPGETAAFDVYDFYGDPKHEQYPAGFDAKTMAYGISWQDHHANTPQQCTIKGFDENRLRAMYWHKPDEPVQDAGGSLFQMHYEALDIYGECGGKGCSQMPPLPMIIGDALPGDVRWGYTDVMHFGANGEPIAPRRMKWRLIPVWRGREWAGWPDTMRNILIENDDDPPRRTAICYNLARHVGIIDLYHARWDEDTHALTGGIRYVRQKG